MTINSNKTNQTSRHRIVIAKTNFKGCCAAAIQYAVALSDNETISFMFCDTEDEVKRLSNAYLNMEGWIETDDGKTRMFHSSGKDNEVILVVAEHFPTPNKLYKNKEALERTKMLSKFAIGEYDTAESEILCRISTWYFTLSEDEFAKRVGEWIYKGESNTGDKNFNIDELNNIKLPNTIVPKGATEIEKLRYQVERLRDKLFYTRLYYAALKHDTMMDCDYCTKDLTQCDGRDCKPEWRGLCDENSFHELAKVKE